MGVVCQRAQSGRTGSHVVPAQIRKHFATWIHREWEVAAALLPVTTLLYVFDPHLLASVFIGDTMHIPVAASIAQWLLPSLLGQRTTQHTDGSCLINPPSIEFRPAHTFTHAPLNNGRSPHLLMQNASASSSYLRFDGAASNLKGPGRNSDISLSIRTKPMVIRRPRRRPPTMLAWAYSARRERSYRPLDAISTQDWIAPDFNDTDGEWDDVEVQGPDIGDRQTLIALAKITSNAYAVPDGGEWWPVGDWNATLPFGWEDDADGLRGHVVSLSSIST